MTRWNLTIIVPCYNIQSYISDCLESIVGQKGDLVHRQVRVFCVNDGSCDETGKILNRYASKYKNIHVFSHTKNKGVSAARNTALCHTTDSRGVMFVDGDDMIGGMEVAGKHDTHYYNQFHLQQLLESAFLPHVGMSVGGYVKLDKNGKLYTPDQWSYIQNKSYEVQDLYENIVWADTHISSCNTIYETSMVTRPENQFNTGLNYFEDALFVIKYLLHTQYRTVYHINTAKYIYRKRDDSAINKMCDTPESRMRTVEFFNSKCYYYSEVLRLLEKSQNAKLKTETYNKLAKRFAMVGLDIEKRKTKGTSLMLDTIASNLPISCSRCEIKTCDKCPNLRHLRKSIKVFQPFPSKELCMNYPNDVVRQSKSHQGY